MPARTNPDAVKALLTPGLNYDTKRNPSLMPFIDVAALQVDGMVELAAADEITYTSERLEMIERWLAAHGYKLSDKDQTSRSTRGASGSFAGQTAMGLDATLYGQQAKTLDPYGYLVLAIDGAGGQATAGGEWLGLNPGQQHEYGA